MKKRTSVFSEKPASSKKAAKDRPKQRVERVSSPRRGNKYSPLEVITIMPEESGKPPISFYSDGLKRVRFGFFNPDAREVFVAGSFNNWNPRATPLKRDSLGDWSVEVRLPPGEYRYRFLVDGDWRDDPSAQLTAMNSYGEFDAIAIV
jgi:hypothetical protein